jgi:hypothetical protein
MPVLTKAAAWLALWAEPVTPEPEGKPLSELVAVPAEDPCLSPGLVEPIAAWLGRNHGPADLFVEVTASAEAVGFVLRRAGEVRVERTLSPAPLECADRRAALGLAIAMALDAAVLESLMPPAPATPLEPAPAVDEAPGVVLAPRAPPEPAPIPAAAPLRLALALEAGAAFGVLPRVALGGTAALELGVTSWLDLRVAGGAAAGLPATLAGGEVTSWLGAGALAVCPGRALGERVRLRLCAGVDAGTVRARGHGFAEERRAVLPWVAVRTGADLDVRLGTRVALRAGASLLTPVVRGQLDVRDQADAIVATRAPASAGAQAGLGVVVRLAGP